MEKNKLLYFLRVHWLFALMNTSCCCLAEDYSALVDSIKEKVAIEKPDYQRWLEKGKEETRNVEEKKAFEQQFGNQTGQNNKAVASKGEVHKKPFILNHQKGLYIFVTLSMPTTRLIEISYLAKKIKGKLVLRGLVNNNFKETLRFIQGMQEENVAKVVVDINPNLYALYNITHVPSFVLFDGSAHDKITGNLSIHYVLEKFASYGETKKYAEQLIVEAKL